MKKVFLKYLAEKIDELLTKADEQMATKTDLAGKVDKVDGKGLSTNDYSAVEKAKLAGIQDGAQKNRVTSVRGALELYPQVGDVVISAGSIGLGDANTRLTALENDKLDKSEKGATNGVASLDENGRVPSSQLPSYVDDVIEVANYASLPTSGESGKIYITQSDNKTYRWSGSGYAEISASLALGEVTGTAYDGAKGKKNAEDIAKLADDLGETHQLASNAESVISELAELTIPAIENELENKLGKTEKAADSSKLGGQLPDYYSPKEGSWYFNENITAEVGWCTVAKYPTTTPLQPRGKFKFLLVTLGGSYTPLVEEYEGDISWSASSCYFGRNVGYSQFTYGIRLINDGSNTHLQVNFIRSFSGAVVVPYNSFVACTSNQSWQWQSGALVKSEVESGVVEANFGFSNGFSHSRSIQALGGFIGNLEGTASKSDTIRVVGTVETNGWFPMLMTNNGSIGTVRYDTLFIGKENNVLYNPSTGALIAAKFIGALQGNADSASALIPKSTTVTSVAKASLTYHLVLAEDTGSLPRGDNANALITIPTLAGNLKYLHQLGFTSKGLFHRKFYNKDVDTTTPWSQIAFTDSTVANASQLGGVGADGYTRVLKGITTTANNHLYIGTLPASSSATRDSISIRGTIGGFGGDRDFVDIAIGRRGGLWFKGLSTFRYTGTSSYWDIAVNNAGEVYVLLYAPYCAYHIEVSSQEVTIFGVHGTSPSDTNWRYLSEELEPFDRLEADIVEAATLKGNLDGTIKAVMRNANLFLLGFAQEAGAAAKPYVTTQVSVNNGVLTIKGLRVEGDVEITGNTVIEGRITSAASYQSSPISTTSEEGVPTTEEQLRAQISTLEERIAALEQLIAQNNG